MNDYEIRSRVTGKVIYKGRFPSLRHCVENAVRERVYLANAALAGANLINASLDEAKLPGADLSGANLMGANLSEALLDGADLSDCLLHSACFCYSSLRFCRFSGSLFGATDIAGADVTGGVFSTLSAFSLNFAEAGEMTGCVYDHGGGEPLAMTRPPLVLTGLRRPVALLDDHVFVGAQAFRCGRLRDGLAFSGFLEGHA